MERLGKSYNEGDPKIVAQIKKDAKKLKKF